MVDSTIAEKGAVDSGLARELAVTLVHAPDFESKVGIILKRDFLEMDHLSLPSFQEILVRKIEALERLREE